MLCVDLPANAIFYPFTFQSFLNIIWKDLVLEDLECHGYMTLNR